MSDRRSVMFYMRRTLIRWVCLLVVLVVCLLAYWQYHGVPDWLLADVLNLASQGSYSLDAQSLKLQFPEGFSFHDVRLYRKRVPGAAGIEADEVLVSFKLLWFRRGWEGVRAIRVLNGRFDLRQLRRPAHEPVGEARPLASMKLQLELRNCMVEDLVVDRLRGLLSVDDSLISINGLQGQLSSGGQSGDVIGRVTYEPVSRGLAGSLETELPPRVLYPLLKSPRLVFLRILIDRFEFREDLPACSVDFRRICRPGGLFSLDAQFACDQFSYRGVDIENAHGDVAVNASSTNVVIQVEPLFVTRQEGAAQVGFTVYPRSKRVQFQLASTLNPEAGCQIIGVLTNTVPAMFDFDGVVNVEAEGVVDYGALAATDFDARVSGTGVSLWGFLLDECSFNMRMLGQTNTVRNLNGKLYGGDFTAAVQFVASVERGTPASYTVDARVSNAEFKQLVTRLNKNGNLRDTPTGLLSGSVQLSGLTGPEAKSSVEGYGRISVDDGHVFMLPVFGGLSHFMARVVPGLKFVLRQSDANADLLIRNSKVHSEKIQIEGDVLSLTGSGDYHFNTQLDYYIQVTLMKNHHLVAKLLRFVTYPISKLFEFRLRGPQADPKWYPTNFSTDLFKKLGLAEEEDIGDIQPPEELLP